jgi:hypothetical protein
MSGYNLHLSQRGGASDFHMQVQGNFQHLRLIAGLQCHIANHPCPLVAQLRRSNSDKGAAMAQCLVPQVRTAPSMQR